MAQTEYLSQRDRLVADAWQTSGIAVAWQQGVEDLVEARGKPNIQRMAGFRPNAVGAQSVDLRELPSMAILCIYSIAAVKNIFAWDADKNEKLQAERGLSFEVIVAVIEQRGVLDDIINPSVNFPDQRALVVEIDNYAILVPYVIDGATTFLKTAFPSRRATRLYLNR
jgi:hypothetical protein